MAEKPTRARPQADNRVLYRRGEAALYRSARIHFRGRRGALRKMVRRYLKPHQRDRALLGALTSSVARVLVVALLMLQTWATEVEAQPTFSSSAPANATHATALSGNLSATFSEAMAAGTVSSTTFVVHGGFIGKHSTGGTASTHKDGTYTGGGTTTLTFNPGANFKPGELVGVTLTTGLQNGSAQALTAARVYQFRAAASAGPAVFSNSSQNIDTPTNNTWAISLGDVDGDGDLDVVAGNNTQVNRVYLGNGNGTFASGNDVDTPTNVTVYSLLGDLDGDGDLDLVTANYNQVNRVYLGNGNGTFASGNDVDTPTNKTDQMSLGDLDGDGDLDLVTGNNTQVNRVYLSNGNGTFASGNDVDTPTNATYGVPLGDLDGDGDLDLVTGNYNQVNRVHLGNGNGTFATGSNVDTPSNATIPALLGDVDGDGDLDLVTGNYNQVSRVYLGNGNGTFASGSNIGTATNQTLSAALGDMDGDGDLDLVVGNYNQVNRVYLGNGNGTFTLGSDLNTQTDATQRLALGDIDGDGDLDVATANFSQVNRIYFNSGNKDGTLTASTTLDESSAIALVSAATSSGSAVDLFDFKLTDGGGGDALALVVSQVMVNTSGTGPFSKVTWLLNGPDASNVGGSYSSSANTITFSGLSISVADGANETYTVRGYYNDATSLTEGATFSFSLDGDTGVTTTTGSSMSGSNAAVSNAAAAVVQAAPLVARNLGARTGEGGTVTVSSDLLRFIESTSSASQIVYALGSVPTAGQLNKSGTALSAGGTFTQDDIDNNRISYTHAGGEVFGDGFSFTVSGSSGASTNSISFGFSIEMSNDNPFTDVFQVLTLKEGEQITITNGSLRVLDDDTPPQQIVYTTVNPPAHGRLSMGAFTQRDIDERRLTYRHDGGESTSDAFSFTVDDGNGGGLGLQTLSMQIAPVNDAPVVPAIESVQVAEGQLLVLELGGVDPEGAAVELTVTGLPQGAALEGTTLKWLPMYTQAGTYPLAVVYDDGVGGSSRLRFDIGVTDVSIPVLQPTPALIDFGDLAAGQIAETAFALHNPTPFALQVESFTSNTGVFSVVEPTFPLEIAPDARTEFSVRFIATEGEVGIQQAVLLGATSLDTISVPVAGRSLWSGLETDVEIVDFGARTIGFTPWRRLEVANPGNLPLILNAMLPDGGPFRVEPAVFALAGGDLRDLRVHFAPQEIGAFEQILLLIGENIRREVVLRGRGLAPEEGRVSIDFNLGASNQQQRRIGDARPGEILELQLHVQAVRQIAGWSARIAYDSQALSYVENSFAAGAFLAKLIKLEQVGVGYVEVGGDVFSLADPASGSGVLGTLSFRVEAGFVDETELAVTRLAWRRAGSGGVARDIVYAPATVSRAAVVLVPPGDFDGNGRVDLDDFFLFADQFQRRVPPAEPRFDLDDDGRVHFADFFHFADLFAKEVKQ